MMSRARPQKRRRFSYITTEEQESSDEETASSMREFPPEFTYEQMCEPESECFQLACARLRQEIHAHMTRYGFNEGTFNIGPYDRDVVEVIDNEMDARGWSTGWTWRDKRISDLYYYKDVNKCVYKKGLVNMGRWEVVVSIGADSSGSDSE